MEGLGRDGGGGHPHDLRPPDAAAVGNQLDSIAAKLGSQFPAVETMLRESAPDEVGVLRLAGSILLEATTSGR